MVTMNLCMACLPEGHKMLPGVTAGPPKHCYGRNDRITPGVIGGYRCLCECNNAEYLVAKVEGRYLNDVEFNNLVNLAVSTVVPKTVNESINKALIEAATSAASMVLILKEGEL